jgi:hypothetical protein
MNKITRVIVTAFIPIAVMATASAASAASLAPQVMAHSSSAASRVAAPLRVATPTGCPMFSFCSYISTGSGQGSAQICLHGGTFSNWGDHRSPFGNFNCHKHSGALVNAHTTGAELLFEAKDFNGSEACIAHGSFFSNTGGNFYPDGHALENNINSSQQDGSFTC